MSNEPLTKTFSRELQIEVFGTELSGRQFIEQTRILTITRDGATIPLANKLAPDSELIVRNPVNNKEAIARVVDLIREEIFVHVYAIAFVDSPVNPWQAEFPEAMPPTTVILECSRCHADASLWLQQIRDDLEANGPASDGEKGSGTKSERSAARKSLRTETAGSTSAGKTKRKTYANEPPCLHPVPRLGNSRRV
jgi:hypothetical protein